MFVDNVKPNVLYHLPVTQELNKQIYATPTIPLHLQGKSVKVTVYITSTGKMPINLKINVQAPQWQKTKTAIQNKDSEKPSEAKEQVITTLQKANEAIQNKANETKSGEPVASQLQIQLEAQKLRLKKVETKLTNSTSNCYKNISLLEQIQNFQKNTLKSVVPEPKVTHEQMLASKYFNLNMLNKVAVQHGRA